MAFSFRALKAEEVECRVNQCSEKGVSLLLFKTARTDMDLLDETVGAENWQKDYKTIDGKLFCGIGVKCDGEWIWKWDTGTPSNMEAQKGEASDAAKRAGFCWGIGRELYTAPFIWVESKKLKRLRKNEEKGRWQCYDDFRVTELAVNEGRIESLQICNASNRMAVVYGRQDADGGPQDEKPDKDTAEARQRLWSAITRYAELSGGDAAQIVAELKATGGWQDTAGYYLAKAELFEGESNALLQG